MRITLFEKARIVPVGDEGAALALCYSPRLAYRLLSSLVAWTDSHPSPRSIDSFILGTYSVLHRLCGPTPPTYSNPHLSILSGYWTHG